MPVPFTSNKLIPQGVIAAGSQHTARAAIEVLKVGGNAFDAAVAAGWMSFVAEPALTSAGGGGFMTGFTANGKTLAVDFFVQTPKHKKAESKLDFFPVTLDYGGSTQVFHVGLGSIATPGCIAGLFHIHKYYGRIPMRELVQPAIQAAKEGIVVDDFLEMVLKLVGPAVTAHPSGKSLFKPHGEYPKAGEKWKMTAFADFMEYLGSHGQDEFYRGEISQKVAQIHREHGGYLTREDFEDYKVIERKPLLIPYRDHIICTNPPPSAGGSLASFTLKLMEQHDLRSFRFGSLQHLNALVNAMQQTALARADRLDHKLHDVDAIAHFFDDAHIEHRGQTLRKKAFKLGSTTHFTVADKDMNIASITASTGEGSGFAVDGTGFMFNNMLGEEDLNPKGFHQWDTDQRITSMMSPTLLLKNGRPVMATGSGGANRIRSVLTQVISNHIDFQMGLNDNVASPRLHLEGGELNVEAGFDPEIVQQIQTNHPIDIKQWDKKAFFFGGAHSVTIDDRGNLRPVGDERRTGAAYIV